MREGGNRMIDKKNGTGPRRMKNERENWVKLLFFFWLSRFPSGCCLLDTCNSDTWNAARRMLVFPWLSLPFFEIVGNFENFQTLRDLNLKEFRTFPFFSYFQENLLFFKLCATEINATKGGINGDRENNAGQTGI